MSRQTGHIRKGDKVKVIAGREKGKIGNVLIMSGKGRVIVEGLNKVKRHQKPGGTVTKQGGIIEKEAPLHLSNIMLVCSKCLQAVRVKKQILDDGKKVRVCAKCQEIIDA